jgi:hypothetical protein
MRFVFSVKSSTLPGPRRERLAVLAGVRQERADIQRWIRSHIAAATFMVLDLSVAITLGMIKSCAYGGYQFFPSPWVRRSTPLRLKMSGVLSQPRASVVKIFVLVAS